MGADRKHLPILRKWGVYFQENAAGEIDLGKTLGPRPSHIIKWARSPLAKKERSNLIYMNDKCDFINTIKCLNYHGLDFGLLYAITSYIPNFMNYYYPHFSSLLFTLIRQNLCIKHEGFRHVQPMVLWQ